MYFSFPVKTIASNVSSVIVKADNTADAKKDAESALKSEFGRNWKIVGEPCTVYSPHGDCDVPAKNCHTDGDQWAWIGCC